VVAPPDYSREFFVMSDASKVGLAGIVYQLGDDGKTSHVVGYWSRSLTASEKNYDARELETLAVLGVLTKYRSVLPTEFTLYTDHLNLLKLSTYVSHKTRLSSWANRLSVYRPKIKHVAGAKNVVADWMSRAPWRESNAPLIACVRAIDGRSRHTKAKTNKHKNIGAGVGRERQRKTRKNLFSTAAELEQREKEVAEFRSQMHKVKTKQLKFYVSGSKDQLDQWLTLQDKQLEKAVDCEECARALKQTYADHECWRDLDMGDKPKHIHCHECGATGREDTTDSCSYCGQIVNVLEMGDTECAQCELNNMKSTNINKTVKSSQKQPERLTPKRILQSQYDDPHLQRVHWYYDASETYRKDDRRCKKVLKACYIRWQKNQKKEERKEEEEEKQEQKEDPSQEELVLGPFKTLDELRAYAAPLQRKKSGFPLKLYRRPTGKGVAMSRGKSGFKDELLGENKDEVEEPPVCVGTGLVSDLLWWYHDSNVATHSGRQDTLFQIKKTYYWRTMVKDTAKHVEQCLRCRRAKQQSRESWRNVGQTPTPTGLYHTVFMDVVCVSSGDKGVDSYSGNTHILSIQDRLSGHLNLIPIDRKSVV
jgi:hypothetical protein